MPTVADCRLINFPRIQDPRGNLTPIEGQVEVPFAIRRVYWIYDVPGGAQRGGHAYRELQEVLIALSGSFDVVINDGAQERRVLLNRSYFGLYVPSGLWRHLDNFSTNAVCAILASRTYEEADYVRDYDAFLTLSHAGRR
jgi:glyoxylate utilization-related uncharacterized protein